MGSKYVAFPVTNCNIVSDILEDCCYVYLAKWIHLLRIDTISSKAALSEEILSHYRLKKEQTNNEARIGSYLKYIQTLDKFMSDGFGVIFSNKGNISTTGKSIISKFFTDFKLH